MDEELNDGPLPMRRDVLSLSLSFSLWSPQYLMVAMDYPRDFSKNERERERLRENKEGV